MSEEKKIDRFYVDKKDIDDFNRLKEKDSPFAGGQNKDIFLAAMVVGYHEGCRVKLKTKEGYFREEYLTPQETALIRALAVSEAANLTILLDKQKIYEIAEEYAAGGIKLLKGKVFSGEYGSYAKKLESDLLRTYEKITEKQLKEPKVPEEITKLPIGDLIKSGENESVEFKSSLIWDYTNKQRSKTMGMIIAKTVSSFMNSNGGVILIGVDNDKNILGLDQDLTHLEKHSLDQFELHFTNIINNYLGKINRPYVKIKFEKMDGKDIAIVQVKKSTRPVYIKSEGKTEFYIRSGNSCQPLDISEANLYIKDKWPDL